MKAIHVTFYFAVLCFISIDAPAQSPLGTGFTYQGQIQQNGSPIDRVVHLRFSLWDTPGSGQPPVGGNQLGVSQLVTNVPVTDGVFTVVLNAGEEFGANVFDGNRRWLQIEVCSDPGCSSLSILSPRQSLTGTPYSLRTLSAPWSGLTQVPEGFADGVDNAGDPVWVVDATNVFYSGGNVGIGGNASTTDRLAVSGGASIGTAVFGSGSKGPHLSHVQFGPLGDWYIRSAASDGKVILQDNGGAVSIGTSVPEAAVKLTLYTNEELGIGLRAESLLGEGVLGIARGDGDAGVSGYNSPGGTGVSGQGKTGVFGVTHVSGGVAVEGFVGFNVAALAGRFNADIDVQGMVLKAGSVTRVDHPLDPSQKYLQHSSVESPEAANVYSGNVTTDENGVALVTLPNYFEAFNADFRYQLTVVGQFAQAIVSKEIENNIFEIKTDKPSVRVSWQVTGIRNDAYAKAHPIEVEKTKSDEEQGKYLAPELFGQPKENGIHYRPDLKVSSASSSALTEKETGQ